MKVTITNEEQIFDILKNENNQYSKLDEIVYSKEFLATLVFSVNFKGKTLEGCDIHGHITSDLLQICYEFCVCNSNKWYR